MCGHGDNKYRLTNSVDGSRRFFDDSMSEGRRKEFRPIFSCVCAIIYCEKHHRLFHNTERAQNSKHDARITWQWYLWVEKMHLNKSFISRHQNGTFNSCFVLYPKQIFRKYRIQLENTRARQRRRSPIVCINLRERKTYSLRQFCINWKYISWD